MTTRRREDGSVSIWLATTGFAMIVLAGLAIDLGGHVHTQQRARAVAAEAARTGGQQLQAAPAIRGTAIRDSLKFVNFNEFKNQIEWAQYGKSFNTHVNGLLLEKLPREGLTGKTIKALGAYPLPAKGQLPLFVPVTIKVGG